MGLLTKLKSLLGFEEDRSQVRRSESGVTIERDPAESAETDGSTGSGAETARDAEPEGVDADEAAPAEADESGTTAPDAIEEVGSETGAGEGTVETDAEAVDADEETVDADAEAVEADAEAVEADAEVEPEAETDERGAEAGGTAEVDAAEAEEEAPETEVDGAAEAVEAEEDADEASGTETEAVDADEEAPEAEADDAEVDDAGAEPDEAAGAGEPLEDVKGIGAAYAERLRDAGVEDVADLATADADGLAEETDLSAKRISTWIERAQSR